MDNLIILGAGGHATEVLDILERKEVVTSKVHLFNNTVNKSYLLFDKYKVIIQDENLKKFKIFYLGLGGRENRAKLSSLALKYGLKWKGIRSEDLVIGNNSINIDSTVDIMSKVEISSKVTIGKGSLINRCCSIHHDVTIGDFCELAPNVTLLGNVQIGNNVFIGTGATILPNLNIGDNSIIGAGSLVTKDVSANRKVLGVPAKNVEL